jgi:predicted nucleic acid-binding protein
MKVLFDSNILIDFLQGNEQARTELNRYPDVAISRVTWMEVLIGAQTKAEERLRLKFLAEFETVELNAPIALEAVELRRRLRLKLPDAIILASAHVSQALLVTRNHRDFSRRDPAVRIPY